MSLEDRLYPLLTLYERMPDFAKRTVGSLYRSLPVSFRLGGEYPQFQRLASAFDHAERAAVEVYQLRELRLQLEEAYENCPFYRELYKSRQVSPKDLDKPADLANFPAIEKSDLQQHHEQMASWRFKDSDRLYITTGGSTGVPVGFYLQKGISRPKEQAFLEAMWARVGYIPGRSRLAVIRGHVTTDKAKGSVISYDATRDWLMLSSYHLDARRLPEYVAALRKFQPDILHAYPSAALLLAELLESTGMALDVNFQALLCGSENLSLPQKRLLERVFRCRVFRWYGHSERAVLAGEGRTDDKFYFFPQYGYVEFGGEDEEGLREVIGTSFHNRVMPLIRYRTGDLVEPALEEQGELPWISVRAFRGREQEFLVSGSGRRISLTAFNMHDALFDGLYAVQFYQETPGQTELRYIPAGDFQSSRLPGIEAGVRRKLGDDFHLSLREVRETEKTPRGKHKWLVSRLEAHSPRTA